MRALVVLLLLLVACGEPLRFEPENSEISALVNVGEAVGYSVGPIRTAKTVTLKGARADATPGLEVVSIEAFTPSENKGNHGGVGVAPKRRHDIDGVKVEEHGAKWLLWVTVRPTQPGVHVVEDIDVAYERLGRTKHLLIAAPFKVETR